MSRLLVLVSSSGRQLPLCRTLNCLNRRETSAILAGRRRRSKPASMQNGRREFIYAPHGALFIFSRRYFEAGGYLDGNLFLYGEEISVAEICRSLGLPVIYEPSLRVLHNEHQSTGRVISRFSFECQKNALRYVSSRYRNGSSHPLGSCHTDSAP